MPPGAEQCPACGEELASGSGRIVLLIVILSLIAVFVLAQYLVAQHRQTEMSLARNWFSRGERAMQAGYPDIAAEDYRTALTYDRENDEYRLRLAQALLAANRFNEARAHLRNLWEEEPADAEINLTLGRLYAKEGNLKEAMRYYRNAINGVWRADSREHRIATRFELVKYLLQQHDLRQAEAELIALQADTPQQEDHQLELARLLLQIGDAARAQGVYETVLRDDKDNAQAWLGNGKASLAMGDYRAAERELAAAVEHEKSSAEAEDQLKLAREVLRIAPNLRGLSLAERARRVAEAFTVALNRLTTCAAQKGYDLSVPTNSAANANVSQSGVTASSKPIAAPAKANSKPITPPPSTTPAPNDMQILYLSALQKKDGATEQALRKNPDALEPTMDLALDVEQATATLCPDMTDTDRALLVLANHQNQNLR